MKRAQRDIYRVLADEICSPICCFCRHSRYSGACEDVDIQCAHPTYPLADIADIVGIVIANGWDYATWYEEDGVLKVLGRSDLEMVEAR